MLQKKIGKFGPKVGDVWYPLSSKSGLKPDNFEKDKTYSVLVYTSGTGKKYINQLLGETAEVITTTPATTITGGYVSQGAEKPGDDKILAAQPKPAFKARDFDAETAGKISCASFAAALASPALAMYALNKEDYLKLVKETADLMVSYTVEQQKSKQCLKG